MTDNQLLTAEPGSGEASQSQQKAVKDDEGDENHSDQQGKLNDSSSGKIEESNIVDASTNMAATLMGDPQPPNENKSEEEDENKSETDQKDTKRKGEKKKRRIKVKKADKNKAINENTTDNENNRNEENETEDDKDDKDDKGNKNDEDDKSDKEETEKNNDEKSDEKNESDEYTYDYEYYYSSLDESEPKSPQPPKTNTSSSSPRSPRTKRQKKLAYSRPIALLDDNKPGFENEFEIDIPVIEMGTQTTRSVFSQRRNRSTRRSYNSSETSPSPNKQKSTLSQTQKNFRPNNNNSSNTNNNSMNNDRKPLPRLNRTMTPRSPNEDVEKYVKKAVNKEPIYNITDELYGDILFNLSERRKKYAKQHNYKDGDKMSDAISFVEQCQRDNQKMAFADDFKKNFVDEKSQFQRKLKEFDDETKNLLEEQSSKQRKQFEVLLADQKSERDEHREKWTSTWMIRQYNRCSAQLTTLRKQHSLLLCQSRFKEAEVVNQQIAAKNKEEEDSNSKSYQFDYDSSAKKLREKQEMERNLFNAQCEVDNEKLKGKRKKRRMAYEYKEKRLEYKENLTEDPDKIWNASLLAKVEGTMAAQKSRSAMPSTKMTRGDIEEPDVQYLQLPPLKLDQENSSGKKDEENGKGKPKEKESGEKSEL